MQNMQTMNEEYLHYWGLEHHPFLLAPDGRMMCVTGQYFECYERLKYAIMTNKGGVLIASEDPGLGKTTMLLKLIEDMTDDHGSAFRYAYIDHPTVTVNEMIAQISEMISGLAPSKNKLENLSTLKSALIAGKMEGGRNIIVIDEGQMLCEARPVLQELRALINLTHNGQYLHTFILSGQKALWDTLQEMPEFWQRLPVRYYFTPLRFEETRELVRYRLNKAGLDVAREIFSDEAIEIIHKYAQGLPRTIVAVSDLALLNGYNDKVRKVGFKEVTKAINSMSGRGETMPYVISEKNGEKKDINPRLVEAGPMPRNSSSPLEYAPRNSGRNFFDSVQFLKPVIVILLVILFILAGALGYRIFSASKDAQPSTVIIKEVEKQAVPQKPSVESPPAQPADEPGKAEQRIVQPVPDTGPQKDVIETFREETRKKRGSDRYAVVSVDAANVRSGPDLESSKILTIVRGEKLPIIGEKDDTDGIKWYKVNLYGDRTGWIASTLVDHANK
jgi:type II secretory pathway predicted ATPase ExeA